MSSFDQSRSAILVAEDDPDDRLFLEIAFRDFEDFCELRFVEDGGELLDYLHKQGSYVEVAVTQPKLILLDLHMPRKNGRQALREIKQDARLKNIPVVVWTTSSSDEDIRFCSETGAEGYVKKPSNLSDLIAAVSNIVRAWLQLPDKKGSAERE